MIILEGVDKAGKTTLACKINEWFPELQLKKWGIPSGNPIPEYAAELLEYKSNMLYDRFIYGEIPYSIVKKRERFMKNFELTMLDLMVQSYPHLVIYVCPPKQLIVERLEKEPDSYVSPVDINGLYEEYDAVMSSISSCVYWYSGSEGQDHILKNYLENNAISTHKLSRFEEWRVEGSAGIGTLSPKYLFVGERYNPNAEFQVTFWSGAGKFLISMLKLTHIPLEFCHFTNAFVDSRGITSKQINFFGAEKVIALGEIADRHLYDIGIKHSKAYHPAYWLRFKKGEELQYINQLENACK